MPDYNSMQLNMGLTPGMGAPQAGITPSPLQAAQMLAAQAQSQLSTANMQIQSTMRQSGGSGYSSMQSLAGQHMMPAQGMAGMTPATPIPPYGAPPLISTPFTPQQPAPMFQTAWQQEMQNRQVRADSLYATAIQSPSVMGQAAGYGAGALAGAAAGSRLGPMGALAGAAIGAIGAGVSGFAGGMGNVAQMPFQGMQQQHQMGAAIQSTSQSWMLGGGAQSGAMGGLGRSSALGLAGGIQNMAQSSSFKQATGGMFNGGDLTSMLGQAGQAGLMNDTQNVSQIQSKLRETAIVVRQFMQLTNDPDVKSVIQRMGNMQSMGMSLTDMEKAASNMKLYARAAGMSVDAMGVVGQQAGGAAFGNVGLSPGSGYGHGMAAMAGARQAIGTGAVSSPVASMLGGVQGMAGRDVQMQAQFASDPSVGMAVSTYGGGRWNLNQDRLQQLMQGDMSPDRLQQASRENMEQARSQGGLGAMALYPLQQRMIQSQMAQQLSPEQMTKMRFGSALATGEAKGLTGAGAFAYGARQQYGDEGAIQMLSQASSPEWWEAQRGSARQQRQETAYNRMSALKENAPGFLSRTGVSGAVSRGWKAGPGRALGGVGDFFGGIGRGVSGAAEDISEWYQDQELEAEGVFRNKGPQGMAAIESDVERGLVRKNLEYVTGSKFANDDFKARGVGELDLSGSSVHRMSSYGAQMKGDWMSRNASALGNIGAGAVGQMPYAIPGVGIGAGVANLLTGGAVGEGFSFGAESLMGNIAEGDLDKEKKRALLLQTTSAARRDVRVLRGVVDSDFDKQEARVDELSTDLGLSHIDVRNALRDAKMGVGEWAGTEGPMGDKILKAIGGPGGIDESAMSRGLKTSLAKTLAKAKGISITQARKEVQGSLTGAGMEKALQAGMVQQMAGMTAEDAAAVKEASREQILASTKMYREGDEAIQEGYEEDFEGYMAQKEQAMGMRETEFVGRGAGWETRRRAILFEAGDPEKHKKTARLVEMAGKEWVQKVQGGTEGLTGLPGVSSADIKKAQERDEDGNLKNPEFSNRIMARKKLLEDRFREGVGEPLEGSENIRKFAGTLDPEVFQYMGAFASGREEEAQGLWMERYGAKFDTEQEGVKFFQKHVGSLARKTYAQLQAGTAGEFLSARDMGGMSTEDQQAMANMVKRMGGRGGDLMAQYSAKGQRAAAGGALATGIMRMDEGTLVDAFQGKEGEAGWQEIVRGGDAQKIGGLLLNRLDEGELAKLGGSAGLGEDLAGIVAKGKRTMKAEGFTEDMMPRLQQVMAVEAMQSAAQYKQAEVAVGGDLGESKEEGEVGKSQKKYTTMLKDFGGAVSGFRKEVVVPLTGAADELKGAAAELKKAKPPPG